MSKEPQLSFLIPLDDRQIVAIYELLQSRIARIGLQTEEGQHLWGIWKSLDAVTGPKGLVIP